MFRSLLDRDEGRARTYASSLMGGSDATGDPNGTTLDAAHPIAQDCVGCWMLNEGSGTTATDISGQSNDGTLTAGPTWGSESGKAFLTFDGTDDYVDCPDPITDSQPFTMWCRARWSAPANSMQVLQRGRDGEGSGFSVLIYVETGTNHVGGGVVAWLGGGSDPHFLESAGALSLDTWHTAACTWSPSFGVRLFLDGVFIGEGLTSAPALRSSSRGLMFGRGNGGTEYFDGDIDTVRAWSRALSMYELQALHADPYLAVS